MIAWRRGLVALVAGLALADASIVTLALPSIIAELDTSIEAAAAVLGSYTLALTLGLPAGEALRRRAGAQKAAAAGLGLFATASLACGAAGSVGALIALRAVQAIGAAAVLAATFELIDARRSGKRMWTATAVFGTAAGPALGGALTEWIDWRAIFLLQCPVAATAALVLLRRRSGDIAARSPLCTAPSRLAAGPALALALVSAALTGVLFLLVLLIMVGWSLSALEAGAVMSVLPLAAVAGAAVRAEATTRASVGTALIAAGVGSLAFVPNANVAWVVASELVAGAGMGLALTALAGGLLAEHTPKDAARVLTLRHAGITLALLLLAPLAASELDNSVVSARERGVALVLDAPIAPLDKLKLVEAVGADVDPVDPRGSLGAAVDDARGSRDVLDEADRSDLVRRGDDILIAAAREGFAHAFLLCSGFALLGCVALLSRGDRGRRGALAAATAAVTVGFAAVAGMSLAPDPVRVADPCQNRELPEAGGLDGVAQDFVLAGLDRAACALGSSREELALALVDDDAAQAFAEEHGVNVRLPVRDLSRLLLRGSWNGSGRGYGAPPGSQ